MVWVEPSKRNDCYGIRTPVGVLTVVGTAALSN